MLKEIFYPREWFFTVMQLLGMIGFFYAIYQVHSSEYWLISLFGYFLITCLGITVTFHRLLTHKSFRLWKPLEYIFSFFGNIGCTGSSLGWVFVHKKHHVYADKIGDPHSPVILGAAGAIIGDYSTKFDIWIVKDLANDHFHRFMHRYYMLIISLLTILLFAYDHMIALHIFLIPVFFNTIASRLSNWVDHDKRFGTRSFKTHDQSHNVWWWSYLTFGEGWHNNHHAQPGNYKIGQKWYQFDPGKYVIEFLMLLRLAHKHIR